VTAAKPASLGPEELLMADSVSVRAWTASFNHLWFLAGGRFICIASSGRRFFGTGLIRTARPISAESSIALMTRTSAKPSLPEGSGGRSWIMQLEK
jgi:hypothetical protein